MTIPHIVDHAQNEVENIQQIIDYVQATERAGHGGMVDDPDAAALLERIRR